MSPYTRADARSALCDAAAVWRVAPSWGIQDVIDAAVQALIADLDTPGLRELAGANAHESFFALDPLVTRTLEELGCPTTDDDGDTVAALRALCHRVVSASLVPRDLADFAHRHVGHEGARSWQPFVTLDDLYDDAGYLGYTSEQCDQWVLDEALVFLAGEPSTFLAEARWAPPRQVREPSKRPFWKRAFGRE